VSDSPLAEGVNLKRYYLWSCFDNFEWVFGFSRRFGLVYVDFETQERIWKGSAYDYQSYIRNNGLVGDDTTSAPRGN
jgi:beta-glucosidase